MSMQVVVADQSRLRTLSRGLVGFGIVGLVGAIVATAFLLFAFVRLTTLSNQVNDQVTSVSAVLDKTATAVNDAATTAGSFSTTIASASASLDKVSADLGQVIPRLRDLQTAAAGVSILGSQPLGRLGELFGQIADLLSDIQVQLTTLSNSLVGNQQALAANQASLSALATEIRTLSAQLGSDQLAAAISDVRWLVLALLIVAAIGAGVPAAGALIAGWWLRGWLAGLGDAAPPTMGAASV